MYTSDPEENSLISQVVEREIALGGPVLAIYRRVGEAVTILHVTGRVFVGKLIPTSVCSGVMNSVRDSSVVERLPEA